MISSIIATRAISRSAIATVPRRTSPTWIGIRSNSTTQIQRKVSPHPIYIVALPLTTRKLLFYCKYTAKALTDGKEGLDVKLTRWVEKTWGKMENSTNKINISVVKLVRRLMSEIPWVETCFRSIPSQNKISRYMKSFGDEEKIAPANDVQETSEQLKLDPKTVKELNLGSRDMEPIPLYYPSTLLSGNQIIEELETEINKGAEHHRKSLIISIALLPLTIPFALIPVVPNVPGFYLAYRAYCHLTALKGANYLRVLLETDGGDKHDHHLELLGLSEVRELYINTKDEQTAFNVGEYLKGTLGPEESLLLSEDSAARLCSAFGLEAYEEAIRTALAQERKRLSKEKAE